MTETQKPVVRPVVRLPSQEFMRALEWYYRPRQTFTEWLEANQPKAKSG